MLSDKAVKDIFFDLEKNEQLFRYKLDGISIYFLLRIWIEVELRLDNSALIEKNKKTFLQRTLQLISSKLKSEKKISPDLSGQFDSVENMSESPLLFVSPSVYENRDGFGSHLFDIVKYYHEKKMRINFIQRIDTDTHRFPQKSEYYDTYLPLIATYKDNLPPETYNNLNSLLIYLSEKLNFDFTKRVRDYYNCLINIIGESKQIIKYIVQSKCRYVFTYSVYTEPSILMACHKTNTRLIEIQHGVIAHDTIYFQSPQKQETLEKGYLLMPDYILTLGNEWRKIITEQHSFFTSQNVFNLGSEGYSSLLNHEDSIVRSSVSSLRLVFFLQGRGYRGINVITDFVTQFLELYSLSLKKSNIQIILRSHPNDQEEGNDLSKKYGDVLTVVDPVKFNSIESIVHSDIIFSATSMCLYEALALGKVVVSLNKYKGMTIPEGIKFVDTPAELWDFIHLIKDGEYKQEPIPYLSPFDTKVLDYFLEDCGVS